jgi:hypothetical protein
MALFACLISRTFSTNGQCFSLTTNQRTVLSAMTFQPSELDVYFSMVDLYILEAQRPRISYLKFIWSCVEEAPES